MATMDESRDTPTQEGETSGQGGAAAHALLFSHDEDGQPARKATVKSGAKRAASNDTDADPAPDAGSDSADGQPEKAPAKKATAKKATAKRTTAKKAPAKKSTATKSTDSESSAAAPQAGTPEVAEDEVDPAHVAEEKQEAAPAAPSTFGLLFQAPDLSAVPARQPRQRRTETPSQGADHSHASDARGETDSAAGSGSEFDALADSGAEAGSGSRPARSRGQRGRRSGGSAGEGQQKAGEDRADASDSREQTDSAGGSGSPDGSNNSDDADGADGDDAGSGRRRRRGGKGRRGRGGSSSEDSGQSDQHETSSDSAGGSEDTNESGEDNSDDETSSSTVRRRRRSNRRGEDGEARESRRAREEVTGVRGSTRLEAKRQRRREGREAGRRRTIITEAEFLARRESVERTMVVRGVGDRTQIGVLEDGVLVEHYVSRQTQSTMAGNVYLGRVQNVLPSMEAAFVDIGKGRNAVLYAGEVNWDAAGLDTNVPKRIENALKSGDSVLVQVTKDPIGHKGARLTSQVSLPGRYLVLVPGNSMTGISRKLPDTERARLKKILKDVLPEGAGVIVRTAAEGASEEELRADVERLTTMWQRIDAKQKGANAPALVHGEPDMTVRVIRDVFNEDFAKVVVSGDQAWSEVSDYLGDVAPDLADRLEKWTGSQDVFTQYRVTEALAKAMDRKVWLPSGGSLVIDRTEAMTVVDVNTGKFIGSGGNLEETVTKNNIEAAEEIVRQLRLRDIGGIIVIDFIDMVLESNRDLVVRRLLECLGRDRTKHQVAEVTSLGLVQMTRKRVGAGLIEVFSEQCVHCNGRGILVQSEPIDKSDSHGNSNSNSGGGGGRRGRGRSGGQAGESTDRSSKPAPAPGGPTPAQIAAAAHAAAIAGASQVAAAGGVGAGDVTAGDVAEVVAGDAAVEDVTAQEVTAVAPTTPRETVATEAAVTSSEATPSEVAAEQPAPVTRTRRRRGRVVAPAGPPAGAEAGTVEASTPDSVDDGQ